MFSKVLQEIYLYSVFPWKLFSLTKNKIKHELQQNASLQKHCHHYIRNSTHAKQQVREMRTREKRFFAAAGKGGISKRQKIGTLPRLESKSRLKSRKQLLPFENWKWGACAVCSLRRRAVPLWRRRLNNFCLTSEKFNLNFWHGWGDTWQKASGVERNFIEFSQFQFQIWDVRVRTLLVGIFYRIRQPVHYHLFQHFFPQNLCWK